MAVGLAGGFGEAASAFLRWWLVELAACVPGPVRRRLRAPELPILDLTEREAVLSVPSASGWRVAARSVLDPHGGLPESFAAALRRSAHPDGRVRLRLGQGLAFVRHLDLPQSAGRRLGEILVHEIDRRTPFAAGDVRFGWSARPAASGGQRLDVALVVAKRAVVDRAVSMAEAAGTVVGSVGIVDDDGTVDLLRTGSTRTAHRRRRARAVLAAVAAASVAAAVATGVLQARREAAAIAQALDAAKAESAEADRLAAEAAALRERVERLSEPAERPRAVEVLAAVTDLLPDDTWLDGFTMDGGGIVLVGFSADAARLPGLIEASGRFSNVRFRAPLTRIAEGDIDRFEISAELIPTEVW